MARSERFLLAGALLALAGCAAPDPMKYPCPTYGVLKDAGTLTAFAGNGRDITDVAYTVTLTSPSIECDYDGKKRVDATLKAKVVIDRGPAFAQAPINVPYFVAVTRGQKYVLARQEFATTFNLAGMQLVGKTEVPVEIPLAQNLSAAAYEVIIGLALTPDQLTYNRAHPR